MSTSSSIKPRFMSYGMQNNGPKIDNNNVITRVNSNNKSNAIFQHSFILPTSSTNRSPSNTFNRFYSSKKSRLVSQLLSTTVENGKYHVAEDYLQEIFGENSVHASELVSKIFENAKPEITVSVLCLLGRFKPFNSYWRVNILRLALASSTPAIRDAAIQALEVWRDKEALPVLEGYSDPIPWLDGYIKKVYAEIKDEHSS